MNAAHQRFHVRIPHNRLPASGVGEEIGVRVSGPSVGHKNDSLGNTLIYPGLHPHPAPVCLNGDHIPFFNPEFFCGIWPDLDFRFWIILN